MKAAEENMIRIACNGIPKHIKQLRHVLSSFAEVDYVEWDREQIIEHIGSYDIFIPSIGIVLDNEIYNTARRLKVIATPSTGTDHIDLTEAEKRGILVLSLKNDLTFLRGVTSTAEQALGLLLSVVRRIPSSFDSVKRGEWTRESIKGNMLSGKTLGIIGFGRLGEMMSEYGTALRMNILATDPNKIIDRKYVSQVSLNELLEQSDIITLHLHLNEQTRHLIDSDQFKIIKDGAIIINTSRGAIINEEAMVEALESGKLGGAGLDVLATELEGDIGNSAIVQYARQNNNVVISPHVGGATYEAQEMAYTQTASKVKDWFEHKDTRL
jgi:D-3-phosphoglycerate dehydrogenase